MEALSRIIDILVVVSGFFIWILFVPQIRLLLREKESKTNSLILLCGSWAIQALILAQVALRANWPLLFIQAMSFIGVSITLYLVHYYRRYPGGRVK